MFVISGCRRVFRAFFLILFTAGAVFGAGVAGGELVSPELLKQAGWEVAWSNELPISNGETLDRLSIAGSGVYALSSRNFLVSLDKDKGEKIFSRYVAFVGAPVGEPVLYEDELIFVLGNKLVEMSRQTGKELRARNIEFRIMCSAVRNGTFFYLSGIDKRVHALRESDIVPIFKAAADNESMITSIIADDDSVILGTDGGNVIGMQPDKAVRLWQFDASGAIAGRVVRDGASLFFGSRDTNVYRVDITAQQQAKLVWKHQVPGVPSSAPRVTKAVVYEYVRDKGLFAIDRATGSLLWSLPEGIELLSEVSPRAYVITKNETLVVMDNKAGRKLYSVNFRGVNRFVSNTVDSRMYIADEGGRIACLQPVE
ncbi:MAG: PQQ-binding-like beta-propeller repeat protein [Sedimentisphaerales bacterium]|nr:PQQ-binding-like beta-propeller repeat protein [Sedimentisphaerales bacterium]